MSQIYGLQCSKSVIYNVTDPWFEMRQIHGLQSGKSTNPWLTMRHIQGLQCDRSMVYSAADPWFTTRQIHGLQCGRAEALKAAGSWLRMRFGQSFRMR